MKHRSLAQKHKFVTAYEYMSNSFRVEIRQNKVLDLQLVQSPYLLLNLESVIPTLAVMALMPIRHNGLNSNVMIIDGGINEINFYKIVEKSQLFGVDVDMILDRIFLSRCFTIYQLANLIIYELPKMVEKYKTKLVIITDLYISNQSNSHLKKENEWLLTQTIASIKNIARHCIVVVFSSKAIGHFTNIIS